MILITCGLFISAVTYSASSVTQQETVPISFERSSLPDGIKPNNAAALVVRHDGRNAMRVDFEQVDWPNVSFAPQAGPWNWSDYAGIAVNVFNPENEPVDVCMRVDDDPSADGAVHCNTGSATIPARQHGVVQVLFNTGAETRFWGMRGIPVRGAVGQGPVIDPSHITAFQVFLPRPVKPHTLIIEEVRLFGKGASDKDEIAMPFVDRFGQYIHADWPGKLRAEASLGKRLEKERRELDKKPALRGRDKFGGWAEGPQLDATGWFRTQKVDGKWWLVTPDGHLFFSNGMDCVGTWEQTFIEGRDDWFEWLPNPTDAPYKDMFSEVSGAHSMADVIGGKGRTFNFYRANLAWKYGEDWAAAWRGMAYGRLKSWGFNTIANWSQRDVL